MATIIWSGKSLFSRSFRKIFCRFHSFAKSIRPYSFSPYNLNAGTTLSCAMVYLLLFIKRSSSFKTSRYTCCGSFSISHSLYRLSGTGSSLKIRSGHKIVSVNDPHYDRWRYSFDLCCPETWVLFLHQWWQNYDVVCWRSKVQSIYSRMSLLVSLHTFCGFSVEVSYGQITLKKIRNHYSFHIALTSCFLL